MNSAAQTSHSPKNNLSLVIDSAQPRDVSVEVSGPGIAKPLEYSVRAGRGAAGAGIYAPPGNDRRFTIVVRDGERKATHVGMIRMQVKQTITPSVNIDLTPLGKPERLTAILGTNRLEIQQQPSPAKAGQTISYRVQVFDPDGKVVPVSKDAITLQSATSLVLPASHHEKPVDPPFVIVPVGIIHEPLVICTIFGCGNIQPIAFPQGPFKSIVSGDEFSCALDSAGQAWCWGDDFQLQLGFPANYVSKWPNITGTLCSMEPCSLTPVPVSGGLTLQSITAGFSFACGIDTAGVAWCWGDDSFGTLGVTALPVPPSQVGGVPFANAHKFQSLSAGFEHVCGVTTKSELFCWGSNVDGQLGIGSTNPAGAPTQVSVPGETWSSVSAGTMHTCAIATDGKMFCWGSAGAGELGIDITTTTTDRCTSTLAPDEFCMRSPTTAVPAANGASGIWDRVSTGGGFTCGRDLNGEKTFCWGKNDAGQLGSGAISGLPTPVPVPIASSTVFAHFSSTGAYTCAIPFTINGTGDAVCWGAAPFFGLPWPANNSVSTVPIAIPGFVFLEMAPGGDHLCALDNNFGAFCWGFGAHGELGDGNTADSRSPLPVSP